MKDFESITEKELLYAAYYHLLDILLREEKTNERHKINFGDDNIVSKRRIEKLTKQTDEIHARIIEIETEKGAI